MSSDSLFERHPDDDVLSDFAADQLPRPQADDVEAHVIECPSCTQVLADAERVRRVLISGDVGPMPPEVWSRIEAAIAAEALAAAGRATSPPTGSFAAPADVRDVPVPPPSMSFDEAPTLAWKRFLDEPPAPPDPPSAPGRLGRAVRSSVRTRRDVRTDEQPRWSRLRQRPRIVLAAAAAAVVLVGAGGLGVRTLLGSGSTSSATDSLPGTAGQHPAVISSGADYTAATLADQVSALVARVASLSSARASGSASAGTATVPAQSGVAARTVADPQQLSSCLVGLDEAGKVPVVVDLARYQEREAAVIVVPGQTGSYDVWVVARTCRAGTEGVLAFKKLAT